MISEAIVEDIKSRIDLADLIASYGIQIKSAGMAKKACCPFHQEKTPSFSINERKGFYHCFGCGESGDAIKFVQKMDGLTFSEAVRKLAVQVGIEVEERVDKAAVRRKRLYALMTELAQFYHRCLRQTKEAEVARRYLESRELGEQIQEEWTIGYAPAGMSVMLKWAEKYKFTLEELEAAGVIKAPTNQRDRGYHRFGGRLMFSIRDKQGRVVGFSGRQLTASKNSGKYVNSPETEIFKKSRILFGFDKAAGAIAGGDNPHHEVIICEGQIDCIRMHMNGFVNSVASQGTAFTEEQMKMLKRVSDSAILVYDDDAAGHKATIRAAAMLLAFEMPVKVVSLPGGEDPDSFLRNRGSEAFAKLVKDSESIMSFQVRVERAKENSPDTIDAMNRITRSVLETIMQSRSAVIRAGMLKEAAKLLGLPVAALEEELGHIGENKPTGRRVVPEIIEEEVPEVGRPTTAVKTPPSALEFACCEFLMANEYDKRVATMVGEFLPTQVFESEFAAKFVEAWRMEVADGGMVLEAFAAALDVDERQWFDRVIAGMDKSMASELGETEVLKELIRGLWKAHLARQRGKLAANGDYETQVKLVELGDDQRKLVQAKWHTVKEIIGKYLSR